MVSENFHVLDLFSFAGRGLITTMH